MNLMKKIADLTDRDVIHCPTKNEADAILKLAKSSLSSSYWNYYKEDTCFKPVTDTYCEMSHYEKGNYTIHKASEFLEPKRKFKIGDKVVPISKSITTGIKSSNAWNRGKTQGFMYVTRVDIDKYVCWHNYEFSAGDHFLESDLIPYVEEFVLPAKWYIQVTPENIEILNEWRGSKIYSNDGYCTNGSVRHGKPGDWYCNCELKLIKKDYTEISFETFKKYVLKQDNMLIELPKSWFVKNDGSQLFKDTVIKYLNANYNGCNWYGNVYSYGVNENDKPDYREEALLHLWKDAVELTLEQFIKLTSKNSMEKEIIGYKCPTDLYGGQVKAGTIFKPTSSKPTPTPMFVAVDVDDKVIQSRFELPKEIVETWEPVYKKDEFKVGDWVYVKNPTSGSKNKVGTIDKITKKGTATPNYLVGNEDCKWEAPSSIRLATLQEIESHLIELAESKGFDYSKVFTALRDTQIGDKYGNLTASRKYSATNGEVGSNWVYTAETDTLYVYGYGLYVVYEQGKWATIAPKEKIVSVGGKFNVTIRDGKIWHISDDITSFVREIKSFVDSIPKKLSGYDFIVDSNNITITKSGCQNHNVTIKDWLDVYKQL